MATTTSTTIKQVEQEIDLNTFLDHFTLTRAERTYYQRTYGQEFKTTTYSEWKKIVKLVH